MLLRFRFSNFRSFRTEQELSLIASNIAGSENGVFNSPGLREQVLPVAAIYGANASGKTAVIRALGFMAGAVKWSQTQWQPDEAVFNEGFVGEAKTVPSEFAVDFVLAGIRHQYGFRVNSHAFLREWLNVYPKGRRQMWFERTEEQPISFSAKMPGENRTIEGLVRKNSLYLSAAAQYNHEALSPVYGWFSRLLSPTIANNLRLYGVDAADFCKEQSSKAMITEMLSRVDLGVSDLLVVETPFIPDSIAKKFVEKVVEAVRAELPHVSVPEKRASIRLVHHVGDVSVAFEPEQESNGTMAYLALIGPVVSALKNGAVLCVDELDASLHPLIARQVIRLFNNPATNPRKAQLIFNTHDTNLLSSGVFTRDQVWFTEKDAAGSSHLYPLSDYKPRRQENLENGYLQGRYGAIPFVDPDLLVGYLEGQGEKK